MFEFLAPYLKEFWGPFRLLGSYMALIAFGTAAAAALAWFLLPKLAAKMPRDRGRAFTTTREEAAGKPTGTGFVLFLLLAPCLFLVLPFDVQKWQIVFCLFAGMLLGFLDDRSPSAWGEWEKGALDAVLGGTMGAVLAQSGTTIWLPFLKGELTVPVWAFILIATVVLWLSTNVTNCSDGIDGLAGTLTLLSLFYLGGFLYMVIGHVRVAEYLLLPHQPEGALWAVLIFTSTGSLAGYLWYNAEPSSVLMGDAGSRFFGLLLGVAVMATGNPFVILVVAPVILANGGGGLVKLVLLRVFKRLGFEVTQPESGEVQASYSAAEEDEANKPKATKNPVSFLHQIRFPLHDHCINKLKWSKPQVLLRFLLIQAFVTPLLLVILIKLR